MSPMFISAILGVAISALALGQIAPSISSAIFSKNVDIGMGREVVLAQQILRYKAVEGAYPADVDALIAKSYWSALDNNNGFGGTYTFAVDSSKNQIAISTTIADATNRAAYINHYRHVFKPVDLGSGVVLTTFVMPSAGSIGAMVAATGSIPVSATMPSAASNTYWYDTSGTTPVLKVSDGSTWVATASATTSTGAGVAAPSSSNILSSFAALPVSATTGDVRYVYNAATSSLDTLFYYNGVWSHAGTGSNAQVVTALSTQTLPIGSVAAAYYYDFKSAVSAMFANTYGALTVDTSQMTWAAQGGLPAGLSLNSASGILSGTPTVKTSLTGSSFNVVASYNGSSGQQNYLIKVGPSYLWVKSMSAGSTHTCAITAVNGVKCWGLNTNGQLGDGSIDPKTTPVDVSGLTSGVASISAGLSKTCAVTTGGAAKCWGLNRYGQLGIPFNSSTPNSLTPVDVTNLTSGVASISAGGYHACSVMTGGGAKCWGFNNVGQLGNGSISTSASPTPTDVSGLTSGVASISAGGSHTCVVTTGGAAKCWGSGYSGEIGNGSSGDFSPDLPTPVNVLDSKGAAITGVASIATGFSHTCAVTTGGAALCWGLNDNGQLGIPLATLTSATAVGVTSLSSGVKSITAGGSQTCAVTNWSGSGGAAQCWGSNSNGQLGIGLTTTKSPTPVAVTGLSSGVIGITLGSEHACALTTAVSANAKCWGLNANGQLGNGSTTNSPVPVDVYSEAW